MSGETGGPPQDPLRLFDHDIRAAMSDVIGGLRLIDAARLDAGTRAQFERVRAAGETLAELIDAALMAGTGEALSGPRDGGVDLAGYLAAIKMRWTGRAEEVGCTFVLELGEDLPHRLAVPRMALDRILSNLIGNALKYASTSMPCGVGLAVVVAPEGALVFTVTDDGPGLSEAARARMFTQDGRPPDSDMPGSGLGLHIAKELADRMGAALEVVNRAGGGAVATLRLPQAVLAGSGAGPDLSGLRVLVAEDNPTSQTILRQALSAMGAEARIANDGLEALAILQDERFDIALVDIEMPRMGGVAFMAALRALPDDRARMPVVALTAHVLRDNRNAIRAAGAAGIIGKPVRSAAELGRAILRHVGAGVSDRMDTPGLDAVLQAAGAGAAEVLARLEEDLRAVAGALGLAVSGGDFAGVRGQCHILLSLAGLVGARRLRHLATRLSLAAEEGRLADLPRLAHACDEDLRRVLALIAARRAGSGGQGR